METLLLLIDSIAMVLVLYYSRRNDKLKDGEPEVGFFRAGDPVAKSVPQARARARAPR